MAKGYPKTKNEVCEQPVGPPISGVANVAPDVGFEGGGKRNDEEGVPTLEQLALLRRNVSTVESNRDWKVYSGRRFEVRCFAVEWRSSVLLDVNVFMDGLFSLVRGKSSFILGTNVGKWDWKKKLMFGYIRLEPSRYGYSRIGVAVVGHLLGQFYFCAYSKKKK